MKATNEPMYKFKHVFFALFALAVTSTAAAQDGHNHDHGAATTETKLVPATPAQDPSLGVKEESFDFGKIPQGKPVTHFFEVTNTGKNPLKINNVQASCGCTTPEWDKDAVIAPGATSKIKVGYNAAAEGPFTKFITITYNDNQNKQISIKGEVWKTPASSAPENAGVSDLKN